MLHQALGAANSPIPQGMYSVRVWCVFVEIYDNSNECIFWTGANEAASIHEFQSLYAKKWRSLSAYNRVELDFHASAFLLPVCSTWLLLISDS